MTTTSTPPILPDDSPSWARYKFPKLVLYIKEIIATNPTEGKCLFKQIPIAHFVEKMQAVKYPTFLQFLIELIGIDNEHLKQILRSLPEGVLTNHEYTDNIYNFNKLLYTFHQLGWTDKAELLIEKGISKGEYYLRVNDIRTINSFIYLLRHYVPEEVAQIIRQNGHKFFNKITYFTPKTTRDKQRNPIPNLIYLIAHYDLVLAHKLLKHVRYLTNHANEGNWQEMESPKSILGFCYYQMAIYYIEQDHPLYGKSNHYLSQAIGIFEELNHKIGLCASNFLWAKNTYASNKDVVYTQLLAQRASLYAKESDSVERLAEIKAFLTEIGN